MAAKIFVSDDQWIEPHHEGWRYYDGVHRGWCTTKNEALQACQDRYDYARGITGRPRGEFVYVGQVANSGE